MSHLAFFEQRGADYRAGGQTQDALSILKDRGVNCVRLRLFTSSAAQAQSDPYNSINNLDYTLPLAVRARNAGLQFLLDFHYSDTWADPGHQAKPAAWTSLTFQQLVLQMRFYNSNCIAAFRAAGAMPEYVQVGNEVIAGMLWPDGGNGDAAHWGQFGQLLKAAIQGIRDAAGTNMPKIIVHIDRGGDWGATQWFFDNLNQQGVPFDIIGQSYYPFWHGSLDALRNCLTNTVSRYQKPVLVAETAFPFTNSAAVQGIPASTDGQVTFAIALAQIVKSVPGSMGIGVFWWGTEYQPLSGYSLAGFDSKSFFENSGNVLPVAEAWGQFTAPLVMSATLSGADLSLSWPLSGAGMPLLEASSLEPLVWLPVQDPIQSSGQGFSVTLPLGANGQRFYRLQAH